MRACGECDVSLYDSSSCDCGANLTVYQFGNFLLLDLAPSDPMSNVPLTVPQRSKPKCAEALGLDEPIYIRFGLWMYQFFIVEPMVLLDNLFGTSFAEGQQRVISFQSRSPVMDIVAERMPQTLWVVGMSYVLGTLIAVPIGLFLPIANIHF